MGTMTLTQPNELQLVWPASTLQTCVGLAQSARVLHSGRIYLHAMTTAAAPSNKYTDKIERDSCLTYPVDAQLSAC